MAPTDPTNETNRNQIDILIQNKEDEIDELREQRKSYDDDVELATSAEVAADPSAPAAERAAAANATTGQDPTTVFAQQSAPSPSTDAELFGDQAEEAEIEAQREDDEQRAEEQPESTNPPAGNQGVDLPSGRGDPNRLGDPETLGFGATPESEEAKAEENPEPDKGKDVLAATDTSDDSKEEKRENEDKKADPDNSNSKAEDKDAKVKQSEISANKASVATTGKTDDANKPQKDSKKKS